MIEFLDAGVTAPDSGAVIVKPLSLALNERHISIVGANGSGKSTVAKMINGLVVPTTGAVKVHGLDAVKDGSRVRRMVGYLFTDPSAQLIMPTAIEDVLLSVRRITRDKDQRMDIAMAALSAVGLADRADVPVAALSGGQRQLLAIAGVLCVQPSIVVADEPTTLLDMRWRHYVNSLLRSLDVQLIEITHDLEAAATAERTLVVHDGAVVADGSPAEAIAMYKELMEEPWEG